MFYLIYTLRVMGALLLFFWFGFGTGEVQSKFKKFIIYLLSFITLVGFIGHFSENLDENFGSSDFVTILAILFIITFFVSKLAKLREKINKFKFALASLFLALFYILLEFLIILIRTPEIFDWSDIGLSCLMVIGSVLFGIVIWQVIYWIMKKFKRGSQRLSFAIVFFALLFFDQAYPFLFLASLDAVFIGFWLGKANLLFFGFKDKPYLKLWSLLLGYYFLNVIMFYIMAESELEWMIFIPLLFVFIGLIVGQLFSQQKVPKLDLPWHKK